METVRQDYLSFSNIEWLTESSTCLDSVWWEIWLVAAKNAKLLFNLSWLTDFSFFDVKNLMYTYKQSDQMLFRKHHLDFLLYNVVWRLWNNIA